MTVPTQQQIEDALRRAEETALRSDRIGAMARAVLLLLLLITKEEQK